jgi:type IV pilus assembly protein PilW
MNQRTVSLRERGVTLIELMISMTLGLLIVLAVVQIFGASRTSYSASMSITQVHEVGRFAVESLKPILRQAGAGAFCGGSLGVRNHLRNDCPVAAVNQIFAPERILTGWDFDGTAAGQSYTMTTLSPTGVAVSSWSSLQPDGSTLPLPAPLQNLVVPGTDVIVVRTLEAVPGITGSTLAANTPNQASIVLNGNHGALQDEILLVTNCTDAADLFQNRSGGNNVNKAGGNCTNPGPGNRSGSDMLDWSTSYDDRMQVYRVRVHAYYIGLDAGSGVPGLYRYDLSTGIIGTVHEELVRGVENMQVRYGMSLPAELGGDGQSVDFWLSGNQVTDWGLLVAVHVGLLVRSDDAPDAQSSQQTFNLAGASVTSPADTGLRKRFNVTVALRNQVLVL